MDTSSKERLLDDNSDYEAPIYQKPRSLFSRYARAASTCLLVVILLAGNGWLFLQNQELKKEVSKGKSRFAGLTYDTPVQYHNATDYWRPGPEGNKTLEDELWNNMNLDPIVVALSDSYAKAHDLPISVFRFPWDSSKGTYYLKAFHDLHCLKIMRRSFVDYQRGNEQIIPQGHILHCLDALRQDVMCSADDTPMPGVEFPHEVGNGQIRMCRNWDRLIEWTHEKETEACYHRLTDWPGVKAPLERYAFCPEGSEYEQIQKGYFEEHGHKDLMGREFDV